MKDLFRKISTIWSIVAIILFVALVVFVGPTPGHDTSTYAYLFLFLLITSVTGAAWLWHYFGGSR